jgi:hypothetical protein
LRRAIHALRFGAMKTNDWEKTFREVFARGMTAWKEGRVTPQTMFEARDLKFLASIGSTAQELFDFVDDLQRYGEPDVETALAIAAIRRNYFLHVLQGRPARQQASMNDLPAKTDAVDGIAWLPRLIAKARLKLRGEMPDDLMYGCGGDRAFAHERNIELPWFLELVRDAGDDDRRIVNAVKKAAHLT